MCSPYTLKVPAVTTTETTEKAMKFTGSPHRFAVRTACREGAKREKSQKLSISVEKYVTVSAMAAKKACTAPHCEIPPGRSRETFQPALIRMWTTSSPMTTQTAG